MIEIVLAVVITFAICELGDAVAMVFIFGNPALRERLARLLRVSDTVTQNHALNCDCSCDDQYDAGFDAGYDEGRRDAEAEQEKSEPEPTPEQTEPIDLEPGDFPAPAVQPPQNGTK